MAVPASGHLWRHGSEWGAAVGTTVFAATALSGSEGIPWLMLAAIAFTAGAIGVLVAWMHTEHAGLTFCMCCWWALVTGWTVWARHTSPWKPATVTVWAAGVAALTALTTLSVMHHQVRRADLEKAQAKQDRKKLLREREDQLQRAGCDGVTCRLIEKTRAGTRAHLMLPKQGVTLEKLQAAAGQLDIALRLHRGANRFSAGKGAAEVIWDVIERNVLAEDVPLPFGGAASRSISDPIPVGQCEDGSTAVVTLREVAALIAGLRGSGKSNLINVLIAQLAQCTDAVIFLIDMKGGRTATPWIAPWAGRKSEAQCPKPPVDWVATGRAEAEAMLDAVLAAIEYRAGSGIGGEKITPSHKMPAIIIICDEVAVIFGDSGPKSSDGVTSSNYTLAGKGTKITQLGRSEAIDPVWCAQRGGVTMLGKGDLKSQCHLRFALSTVSQADASMVIPDDQAAAKLLGKIKTPGAGLLFDNGHVSQPVKFYRCDEETVARIAQQTGQHRPDLDAGTAAAMGEVYARRWAPERAGHLVAKAAPAPADDGTGGVFAEIVAGLSETEGVEGDLGGDLVSTARERMRQIVRRHRFSGVGPTVVALQLRSEGHDTARETVHRWLAEDVAAGVLAKKGRGSYGPPDRKERS